MPCKPGNATIPRSSVLGIRTTDLWGKRRLLLRAAEDHRLDKALSQNQVDSPDYDEARYQNSDKNKDCHLCGL